MIRKIISGALLFSCSVLMLACVGVGISLSANSTTEPSHQDGSDPKLQIASGALVVDARSSEEFAADHLPNAINIPHTKLNEHLRELGEDRSRAIVVYCHSGRRAEQLRATLRSMGFTNVTNGGGLKDLR